MNNIAEKIAGLQQQFAQVQGISFLEKRPGFIFVNVRNAQATAAISLYGAQVMEFTPHGEKPVLWESASCYYTIGKPLRGGIPLCWPWFGAHPDNAECPAHGLARLRYWELTKIQTASKDQTELEFTLTDDDETRKLWPHAFRASLKVSVGKALTVELISANPGNQPFKLTEAMHTYFAISDIHHLEVRGFDGCEYLNALDRKLQRQQGDITFSAETDRIYQHAEEESHMVDPGWQRIISNHRSNSVSAVVWNPWIDKSIKMIDFGDNEYPSMVCVETANVGEKATVAVAPGTEHRLGMTVRVLPLL